MRVWPAYATHNEAWEEVKVFSKKILPERMGSSDGEGGDFIDKTEQAE